MGLYVHVPFCKSQCIYCNFSRIFKYNLVDKYIDAIAKEASRIENKRKITTLYIGGGTPSSIGYDNLDKLLSVINTQFDINDVEEYTIECNPDDIDDNIIGVLKAHKVTRISFGVQSLNDNILKFMHRRHDCQKVYQSIEKLRVNDFDNISVDFIYGLPQIDNYSYQEDINKFINLDINHMSAYALSYEEGSPLYRKLNNGQIKQQSDEAVATQYSELIEQMRNAGFDHYEISNFSRSQKYSHHNWLYWQRRPYYGLGPAACAFDGKNRYTNPSNVSEYIERISQNQPLAEAEKLTDDDIYNEIVMLGLRTKQGINIEEIKKLPQQYIMYFENQIKKLLDSNMLINRENFIVIPEQNWFICDYITRKIFI